MIPVSCKRLIEVDFPIAAVSAHSAREKSIRHGHPSTLHLWWARRPLAACRSVLLGLLLPDPCQKDCPPEFKKKARELLPPVAGKVGPNDEHLQRALLKFIGDFANWDCAANQTFLQIGRGLVKAAHLPAAQDGGAAQAGPYEPPVVVDPFAGGGSIPLEALRLGCETFASDLNPVACLILKTLLEDIPRYGNAEFRFKKPKPLIDTNKHESKTIGVHSSSFVVEKDEEIVIHGLANALRHVGRQVKETAEKELAQFYPPDSDGSRPIAYLWARTVRCEGIGCGAEIPLVRSFWLSKKAGRKRALRYVVERGEGKPPQLAFEIFEPKEETEIPTGTVTRANATCPCCHVVLPATRVRSQLAAQRGGADAQFDSKCNRTGGARLLAVVTLHEGATGRFYRLPTPEDYAAVFAAQKAAAKLPKGAVPDEPLPPIGTLGFRVQRYGMLQWGDLFTARQKLAFVTLAEKVSLQNKKLSRRLGDALLAMICTKLTDRNNALVNWSLGVECPNQLFKGTAVPFGWDFCESNLFSDSSGSIEQTVDNISKNVEASIIPTAPHCSPQQADAAVSPLPDSSAGVWFTDPPYYDAVPYSDLSDFFLVWFKRAIPHGSFVQDPFNPKNPLSPKNQEIVQDDSRRVGDALKDRAFFETAISKAFSEGRRVLRSGGIGCVVFAHKSTEGWEALLGGMLSGGWVISASWPITTERYSRMRARDSAALAGSVHLVCRPRPTDAGVGDWSEVKVAMEKRIREWLPTLVKHGVRGADAIFSCLGPALESYSRYDKVLTAADREVPLGGDPDAIEPHERGFLAYVFETLSKEALRQVLGDLPAAPSSSAAQAGAETEGFEEDARLTALFLWTLQTTKTNGNGQKAEGSRLKAEVESDEGEQDEEQKSKKAKAGFTMPFDTFIRITRPMGIHYQALEGRLLEIEKGVVRLLPVKERTEELLGEAAQRPGIEISLDDFRQLELGLVLKPRMNLPAPSEARQAGTNGHKSKNKTRKGNDSDSSSLVSIGGLTTLDRLHRAMLLFGLGRSTLLRQLLETEMRQGKRFERLALALNALYPEGSDERRMLEGVQAAMRGIK